jgi:hypothetical protein
MCSNIMHWTGLLVAAERCNKLSALRNPSPKLGSIVPHLRNNCVMVLFDTAVQCIWMVCVVLG